MDLSIVWFRRDLRLQDNEAVAAATAASKRCLYIFIIDPWFFTQPEIGWLRVKFLFESLAALDRALQRHGNRLLILRGESVAALSSMLEMLTKQGYRPSLFYNHDSQVAYGRGQRRAPSQPRYQQDHQ